MIVRGGTDLRTALRVLLARNWLAVVMVLAIELGAYQLHRLLPGLHASTLAASAVGALAATVGIFLAFKFNAAYGRWWEARTLWGGMLNASRTWARQVTTLLTPAHVAALDADGAAQVQRELVHRHLAYVHALRLRLRGLQQIVELEPWLDARERDDLRDAANVPAVLVQRQAERIAELLRGDVAERLLLVELDRTLTAMIDLQGGMERIKNTAFPDRVVVVTRVFVWLLAALIAFAAIEPSRSVDWFEFAVVLVVILSFIVVKQLGDELNDPFEGRANDTPMTALCRTIEIDLRQRLGERDVPPPLAPRDGVLP